MRNQYIYKGQKKVYEKQDEEDSIDLKETFVKVGDVKTVLY